MFTEQMTPPSLRGTPPVRESEGGAGQWRGARCRTVLWDVVVFINGGQVTAPPSPQTPPCTNPRTAVCEGEPVDLLNNSLVYTTPNLYVTFLVVIYLTGLFSKGFSHHFIF